MDKYIYMVSVNDEITGIVIAAEIYNPHTWMFENVLAAHFQLEIN